MSKVTIKVTKPEDVQVGDLVCGWKIYAVSTEGLVELNKWGFLPKSVTDALCASGHVTREVEAVDALEREALGRVGCIRVRCEGEIVGLVDIDDTPYFKVYDTRFTAAIEAMFKEITGDKVQP